MKATRHLLLAIIPVAAAVLCNATSAQDYPSKPIHIVVGVTPGGSTDMVTRLLANRWSQRMQRPVIVENKPGGNGNIAADLIAKSKPDGYALLLTPGTHVIMRVLDPATPFDPIADFEPVGAVVNLSYVVLAGPRVSANNLRELIAHAKANPGKLSYSTPGQGTMNHLAMELLKQMAGVDILPVHYKGGPGAMTDVIAGHIDLTIQSTAAASPFVRSGKVKALVVAADSRFADMPDIPTSEESGLPQFTVNNWLAVLAPAGTPRPVVERLNAEIANALQNPEMKTKLSDVGARPFAGSPQSLASLMKEDQAKWAKLIQTIRIKAE
ncbi:MAG: tripartite tricarboxylate transporter substrate binding protein [Betaproteobacteria bacterium]|nr:tripartite tricarboxylate transporter substrate binding protein [Betaproteobacteria bacterium]